jgi:A/G-specific adenine glycosylase
MWTDGLADWYERNGRHHLPWRRTTEPWPVLVSEVMLQQTSVTRVVRRWEDFLARWPDPAACAGASLDEVLRQWQGLGYPRRARALWLIAARITAQGWPADEAGLMSLPGVGRYTARALLAFTDLGMANATQAPADVNVTRIAARAAIGGEPDRQRRRDVEAALSAGRPSRMRVREYTYALFDVGALHCRATPHCDGCPLAHSCAARRHGIAPERPRAGATGYRGSFRQLRGAILAAALKQPGQGRAALRMHVAGLPATTLGRFDEAVTSLVADGLLPPTMR